MQKSIVKVVDKAAEQIERATSDQKAESKQPRFGVAPASANTMFQELYGFVKGSIFDEPKYYTDSRRRDAWLAQVVLKEPYLLGILQSVVSIDKNRGFTITGGKTQVKRFMAILHSFQVAPDLFGWRPGLSVSARNFYQSDLGSITEIGRAGVDGPLAAIYTVDPTKCRLTGLPETPLNYTTSIKENQKWGPADYFRVASFPSTLENMNGLGYCAVSRCLELAKMMVAVFEHNRERLGSKAPKGILTINGGLTMQQWIQSLEESTAEIKTLQREYYSGVQVLVGGEGEGEIKVDLTSLSTLPEEFDYKVFVDTVMFGYALEFGYDPREFWPVSSGTLGTGNETNQQHRKASSKGGLDFALGFQEELQDELPDTIQFEFEQRDVEGDIAEIAFQKAKFDIINNMYMSKDANNMPLITHDQALQLMVEAKLIPEEWTITEEPIQATDTDDIGDMLQKQRVQNALKKYPNDDIVIFSSNTGKFRTIRKAGAELKFMIRATPRPKLLASVKGVDITSDDLAKAMKQAEKRLGKKATKAFAGEAVNG